MTEEIPSSSLDAATLSQKGRPSLPVATSSPEVASTASSESIVSMTSKAVRASSDEGVLSPQKRSLPSPVAPSSGIAAEAAAPTSTIPTPAPTPPATKKTKAREVLALTSIASRTPRMEADITTRLPARKKRKACPSDEPNASATGSRLVSVSVPGEAFTTQLPALITPLLDESESDDVDQEEVICESERKRKRDVLLAANGDVNVYQDGEEGEYEIMVSDGPSENESSDFDDSRLASLDFTADWSDDAVAAYMADVSSDINDDDALLALAKNKTEIKEWETTGWGEGNHFSCCYIPLLTVYLMSI
ncbi:hypothetical protein DVH05_011643 [Phytophthora capsici]|nr:hypothetical protein DVH05_011643 [Phytophthora capsici]